VFPSRVLINLESRVLVWWRRQLTMIRIPKAQASREVWGFAPPENVWSWEAWNPWRYFLKKINLEKVQKPRPLRNYKDLFSNFYPSALAQLKTCATRWPYASSLATALTVIRQRADKDSQGSVTFQKTYTRVISRKVGGSEIEVAVFLFLAGGRSLRSGFTRI